MRTWHLSFLYPACLCLGVSCTVCVRRGGCACLVLPHGSHTGTLGLPDGFWLPGRFGFPSAYSSPIHVVFLDRVFHSARVGITWHSRAAGFAPPRLVPSRFSEAILHNGHTCCKQFGEPAGRSRRHFGLIKKSPLSRRAHFVEKPPKTPKKHFKLSIHKLFRL